MTSRGRRRLAVTAAVALTGLALSITGLAGAYSYWESYYVHRGFAPVALVHGAHRGKLERIAFYSPALHRTADYLAYLPPGYRAGQRYPVDYLLHGSPGQPSVYLAIVSLGVRMDNLIGEHRMRPMILVFPNGEVDGSVFSDSEWANTPTGAYENAVVDVVHDVDHRFSTLSGRAHRVIAGFSAGGYGAVNIALHHLDLFGNLQSWSGYFRQTRTGVFAHASPAELAANSPLRDVQTLAARLAIDPLRAFLFTGRDDNLSPQTIPMARALAAEGATVSYALYRGGHDWQLWRAHVNQMLILASRDTHRQLVRGSGRASTLTPGVTPIPHGLGRRHPRRHGLRRGAHHHRQRRRHRHRAHPGRLPAPRPGAGGPFLSAGTVPVAGGPRTGVSGADHTGPRDHGEHPRGHRVGRARLLFGLLLALASAALINLGFLLQHRGMSASVGDGLAAALRRASRSRAWLTGQLLGWIGFAAQIIAVAMAPLSLVQSFAAGGLALSVPLAAWCFAHRITRAQTLAVLVMAVGLAVQPIGFGTGRDHLHPPALALITSVAVLFAVVLCTAGPAARAVAAGIFYGVADAAIKAISVGFDRHGAATILSPWTAVAAMATFGGFLAFQAALRDGSAITGISLMNALSAIVALAGGLVAFGESLGAQPLVVIGHVAAIVVVLGCVPVLARAQAEMAQSSEPAGAATSGRRPLTPTYDPAG
jgi:enterochelin esterase-like enzyme